VGVKTTKSLASPPGTLRRRVRPYRADRVSLNSSTGMRFSSSMSVGMTTADGTVRGIGGISVSGRIAGSARGGPPTGLDTRTNEPLYQATLQVAARRKTSARFIRHTSSSRSAAAASLDRAA